MCHVQGAGDDVFSPSTEQRISRHSRSASFIMGASFHIARQGRGSLSSPTICLVLSPVSALGAGIPATAAALRPAPCTLRHSFTSSARTLLCYPFNVFFTTISMHYTDRLFIVPSTNNEEQKNQAIAIAIAIKYFNK